MSAPALERCGMDYGPWLRFDLVGDQAGRAVVGATRPRNLQAWSHLGLRWHQAALRAPPGRTWKHCRSAAAYQAGRSILRDSERVGWAVNAIGRVRGDTT